MVQEKLVVSLKTPKYGNNRLLLYIYNEFLYRFKINQLLINHFVHIAFTHTDRQMSQNLHSQPSNTTHPNHPKTINV